MKYLLLIFNLLFLSYSMFLSLASSTNYVDIRTTAIEFAFIALILCFFLRKKIKNKALKYFLFLINILIFLHVALSLFDSVAYKYGW